jgi:AcrR family transcriptional regulator
MKPAGLPRDGAVVHRPSRRGRPRCERARRATLAATAELVLERGDVGVSLDVVAERAGVSKATIYRWWPSKELLVLDALQEWIAAAVVAPDTGSLRGDLLGLVVSWVREVRERPFGSVIAALVAEAQANPEFAECYHRRVFDPRREPARAALARAIARGEVREGLDVETAIDLVHGPLHHRLLHGHGPLTERFASDIVDMALTGMLRPPG